MEATITYSDCWDRPAELTPDELSWFYKTVEIARQATGCTVPIIPYDHDLFHGKHRNALGCCITKNPGAPLSTDADTTITIDCYFIDECYRHEFNGDFLIAGQTLQEVIAHEIAHLTVWRHGKKHNALSLELLHKIDNLQINHNKTEE